VAAQTAAGKTVTGPDGLPIAVPPPTTGSGPTSFSYSATSFGIRTGETVSLLPTFVGETESGTNTYVFSSYDSDNTSTVKPLTTIGLSLDATTGAITGTPTSFAAETSFLIKAYHIESGKNLTSITLTFKIATDLTNLTLYYPQTALTTKLILKLDVVTAFTFPAGSVTSSSGAEATVDYVDSANKELYLTVTDDGPNDTGFVAGEDVDNASSFVVKEATISSVTYAVPTIGAPNSLAAQFYPNSIAIGSTEWNSLVWGITPDTPPDTGKSLTFTSDDGNPSLNGQFNISDTKDSLETTEYTVTVRNTINDIKQIKVRFNISNAPTNLNYGNNALLTVDDNSYFNVGDTVTSNGSGSGLGQIARKFSTDHLVVRVKSGEFKAADLIDNVSPYATSRAIVSQVDMINAIAILTGGTTGANFATGSGISSASAADTGVIAYKDTTSIVSLVVTDAAEAAKWSPGDMIVGRTTTSQTDTGVGNVLGITSNTIYVHMISGTFVATNCLQNRNVYYDPANTDCSVATAAPGDGRVTSVNSFDTLYIKTTKGGFQNGQTIYYSLTGSGTSLPLIQVFSDYLTLTFTGAVGTTLKRGYDITTAYGAAGVVDSISGSTANVMVENGIFNPSDTVDDANPYVGTVLTLTATGVKSAAQYNLYRGEAATIKPSLSTGDNVTYRLVPDSTFATTLPAGLSLDATTGIISGTPTQPFVSDNFRLEARNAVGSVTHDFNIQVLDAFFLENLTTNAPSFKLHKSGRSRHATTCRISSAQLGTTSYLPSKDIVCLLEAGELDLYERGLTIQTSFGAGMCNFITFTPYQFHQFQYKKTGQHIPRVYYKYVKDAACTGNCTNAAGAPVACAGLVDDPIPTSLCDGKYTSAAHPTWPNCDDGFTRVTTITYKNLAGAPADCLATEDPGEAVESEADTACGGLRSNCVNGPAKDMFGTSLDLGVNGSILAAGSGGSKSWTFASPNSKSLKSNLYLANFAFKNSCSSSASDNNFEYYGNSWQKYAEGELYQVKFSAAASTGGAAFNPGSNVNSFPGALSYKIYAVIDDDTLIVEPVTGSEDDLNGSTTLGGQNLVYNDSTDNVNAVYAFDAPQRNAQPFYDFNCLNSSHDTIGRIRLVVRDWNRDFNSTSRIDRVQPDLYEYVSGVCVGEVTPTRVTKVACEGDGGIWILNRSTTIPAFMEVTGASFLDPFGNDYNNRGDWDDYSPILSTCGPTSTSPMAPIAPSTPTLRGAGIYSLPYPFPGANL